MDKRSSKKREHDFSVTAFRVVQEATTEQEDTLADDNQSELQAPGGKNPHAVALGRLGGKKGGPARAARLTAAQRSEIAKRAAEARWGKQ